MQWAKQIPCSVHMPGIRRLASGLLNGRRRTAGYSKEALGENDLLALRKATNDCTMVGNDKFQAEIATMLARRVKKYAHGGDRRSELYKQLTG